MSSWKQLEVAGELEPEPLLIANPGRFVIFPIQHNDVSAAHDRWNSAAPRVGLFCRPRLERAPPACSRCHHVVLVAVIERPQHQLTFTRAKPDAIGYARR